MYIFVHVSFYNYYNFCQSENKKEKAVIADLKARKFDSDPVKTWKKSLQQEEEKNEEGSTDEEGCTDGLDYNYLLSMAMRSLTYEKVEELLKSKKKKVT